MYRNKYMCKMNRYLSSATLLLACLLSGKALSPAHAQAVPQFSPQQFRDDPTKEWCYLQKSLTAIGVPFQKEVSTVTYDGSLFNGDNELNFYYGDRMTPVFARQKTFFEGWIPIVQYEWSEQQIDYSLEIFAFPIQDYQDCGAVNFAKLTARNTSSDPSRVTLAAATRGHLDDYRPTFSGMNLHGRAQMNDDEVTLDGRMIYAFDKVPQKKYAIDGEQYTAPFVLSDKGVLDDTPFCATQYEALLKHNEKLEVTFKMALDPAEGEFARQIKQADYEEYRQQTIDFWRREVGSYVHYTIPESRVNDAYRASLVHVLLATRTFADGSRSQTDGVPYPMFFLTSAPQMMLAYLTAGKYDMARMIITRAVGNQLPDGLYYDRSLAHIGVIPTAHGHVLYMLGMYWAFTHDVEFAQTFLPSMTKAMDYLRNATSQDSVGLLPPTYQYDNEMIDGHYTCNNLWALLGLRLSIRMARDMNWKEEVACWTALEEEYTRSIQKAVDASVHSDGYVPTGLYDFRTGSASTIRKFPKLNSDCDWENMLLAYPTELYKPYHPYVSGTLEHVRKGYAEGIMTYRHGLHLHQYITANMIEQYMVRGESRQALIDFYHLLLHCGSTHEGFENMVWPWQQRQLIFCLPPHAWASGKIAVMIRNLLLYEYDGRSGLDEGRNLYLFSTLSPEWLKPGDKIEIKDAPCEMGTVSATLQASRHKAIITFSATYSNKPSSVRFRIPYCKRLLSFHSDDPNAHIEDGCIVLSPDFRKLTLKWEDNPEAYTDNFAHLLELYRECNVFLGVDVNDDKAPVIRPGKAFLKPGERDGRRDSLNFRLVRDAFLYEMNRRHADGEVPDYKSKESTF